ncbi:hypothetical protein BO71DRAFT_353148 [Aspergillus ellipticus CBS 707.79]|uniref:NAD(P)-binding domain-containing protein n=1 Tax=Aspergillus ellipticus CBS 707.79 TaxID=1448320 RepID=A0A319DBC1_9EURO|nr:hypothetical protein BO71DRAFT_353148 [Aspergillus ellipticus CBS 707.79]
MATQPTLAFFGATGGCINACLELSLKAGYHCTALARTPSKLEDMLRDHEVPEHIMARHLTIIKGNIMDVAAVQQTLFLDGRPVGLVFSGIGGKMQLGLKPTLDNPTICQDGTRTILTAARACQPPPRFVTLSTTGITQEEKRDLPVLMMPMYHWMLKVPHADKKVMEELIFAEMRKPVQERAIQDFMMIRPSLLTDGTGDGLHKIRTGTEAQPAVGYVIARYDVGRWLFGNVVEKAGQPDAPYWGQRVSITL